MVTFVLLEKSSQLQMSYDVKLGVRMRAKRAYKALSFIVFCGILIMLF